MNGERFASFAKAVLAGLLCFTVSAARVGTARATNPHSSGDDLNVASRTILGITLGHATLAQVQAKLGPAKLWATGDASEAEIKVCYVTQESDPIVLVFGSNDEMAGPPENEVTDIRIVKGAAYPDRLRCGSVAIPKSAIVTKSGLKLGLTQDKIRSILGPAKSIPTYAWRYTWSVDRLLPSSDKSYRRWLSQKEDCFDGKAPYFTVSSVIDVQFVDDLVVGLLVARNESIC